MGWVEVVVVVVGGGRGDELVFHCVSTVCHAMQLYGCRLFSSLRRCGVMETSLS